MLPPQVIRKHLPKPMLWWMMKSQAGVLSLLTGKKKHIKWPKNKPLSCVCCVWKDIPNAMFFFLKHIHVLHFQPAEGLSKIFSEHEGGDSCETLSSGSVLINDETNFTCGKISSFVKFVWQGVDFVSHSCLARFTISFKFSIYFELDCYTVLNQSNLPSNRNRSICIK